MNILHKLNQIKENYYLDSLSETDLSEQDMDQQGPAEENGNPNMMPPPGQPPMDPNMMPPGQLPMDPNMMPPGQLPMDPNMMPPPGQLPMDPNMMPPPAPMGPPIKTITQLGRIYELQKIYSRLQSISDFLMSEPDTKFDKIKEYVNEAFEIFKLVLNNIKSYMNNLDDVILDYNKFISNITILLSKYVTLRKEILSGE